MEYELSDADRATLAPYVPAFKLPGEIADDDYYDSDWRRTP